MKKFEMIKCNHYALETVTVDGETTTNLLENQLKATDFDSKEQYSEYKNRLFTIQNALFNAYGNLNRADNRSIYGQRSLVHALCTEILGMDKCELTCGEMDYLASKAVREIKDVKHGYHVPRMTSEESFRRGFERMVYYHCNGIKRKGALTPKQKKRLDAIQNPNKGKEENKTPSNRK